MPKLSQAIDGHYYTRTLTPGFTTYQICPEGVSWLAACGISVGDEIGRANLVEMVRLGLATTGGSGPGEPDWVNTILASGPVDERRDGRLRLAIAPQETGWELSVLVPELPSERAHANILSECGLRVDGQEVVNGMDLWPGQGGAACPVTPHEQDYAVKPEGAWPKDWNIGDWFGGLKGLNPAGSIFLGGDLGGVRLESRAYLVPGETYYFVAMGGRLQAKPLAFLDPRFLGTRERWDAWEIILPVDADEKLRTWCKSVGHELREPHWRLALVSPPPVRYDPDGTAVVQAHSRVLVAVTDAKTSAYYERYLDQKGLYRLGAEDPRIVPLMVRAIPKGDARPDLASPRALSISVRAGGSQEVFGPFDDGPRPRRLEVPADMERDEFSLVVSCPVPLQAELRYGSTVRRIRATAVEVSQQLAGELERWAKSDEAAALRLDAGAFGRVELGMGIAETQSRVDLSTDRLAHWLLVAGAGPRQGIGSRPVRVPESLILLP